MEGENALEFEEKPQMGEGYIIGRIKSEVE